MSRISDNFEEIRDFREGLLIKQLGMMHLKLIGRGSPLGIIHIFCVNILIPEVHEWLMPDNLQQIKWVIMLKGRELDLLSCSKVKQIKCWMQNSERRLMGCIQLLMWLSDIPTVQNNSKNISFFWQIFRCTVY